MSRPRPPRSTRARQNPLQSDTDVEVLLQWLNGKDPEDITQAARIVESLKAPNTDTALASAVQEFFRSGKRSPPRRELTSEHLFSRLAPTVRKVEVGGIQREEITHPGLDVFSTVKARPADRASWEMEDAATEALHQRADLLKDIDFRRSVAMAGELTGEEALEIQTRRSKSKARSRIVSVSGAFCGRYRNVVRLSAYTPPREVLQKGTCWILIGPAIGRRTPQRARVMSFRNGAHIDCDSAATEAKPLSEIIAKAIEGMVLWMIEKPSTKDPGRPSRTLSIETINIAQVGRPSYRVLWPSSGRGLTLNAAKMLENAYSSDPIQAPWYERDKGGVVDLENYIQAVQGIRSGSFDTATHRFSTGEAPSSTVAVKPRTLGIWSE